MTSIDYGKLYSDGLPEPAPKWAPFPPYYFVGGNNDPEEIPIEGLVEAAASVLRREGSKLAIYNLGLGPQGYPGLRQFVADRCKRVRGMDVPIDDVMIVTGSGQSWRHSIVRRVLLPGRDAALPPAWRETGSDQAG